MRPVRLALLLLLPVFLAPRAHADQLDDFALTGPGLTITFTTPAVFSFPDQLHLVAFPSPSVTATLNGVPDHRLQLTVYSGEVPGRSLDIYDLSLYGANIAQFFSQTGAPGNVTDSAIFVAGTYPLFTFDNFPYLTYYTLTITPEAAPVPEPSTLSLLTLGALGASRLLRRRSPL